MNPLFQRAKRAFHFTLKNKKSKTGSTRQSELLKMNLSVLKSLLLVADWTPAYFSNIQSVNKWSVMSLLPV